MKEILYNVSLFNDTGIFDSCDGFETLDEALDWAAGRGGYYGAELVKEVDGVEQYPSTTVQVKGQYKHQNKYDVPYIHGHITVTREQLKKMI